MTKPVIVTRLGKGSELTFAEGDANFTNLQNATVTIEGDQGSVTLDLNSTVRLSGGDGINTEVDGNTVILTGFSGDYNSLVNTPLIPTDNAELINGAGYIREVTESDVTAHQAALSITQAQISDLDNFITGPDLSDFVSTADTVINGTVTAIDAVREPNTLTLSTFAGLTVGSEVTFTGTDVTSAGLIVSGSYYIAADLGGGVFEISDGPTNPPVSITAVSPITDFNFSSTIPGGLSLSDLNDVTITTPNDNDVLQYNNGVWGSAAAPAESELRIVNDATPALGGPLDVNGQSIVSESDGDIVLAPNGVGAVVLSGIQYPTLDGTTDQVLTTNGAGVLSFATPAGGGGGTFEYDFDVQTFSTPGTSTWIKPSGCGWVLVYGIGAGGGGGSGRRGAIGANRTGGGGGGGQGSAWIMMRADTVPSSVTVTVNAGGTGGAAATQDGANGTNGGGNATGGGFGNFLIFNIAPGGFGGGAGTVVNGGFVASHRQPTLGAFNGTTGGQGRSTGGTNGGNTGGQFGTNGGNTGGGGGAGAGANSTASSSGGFGGAIANNPNNFPGGNAGNIFGAPNGGAGIQYAIQTDHPVGTGGGGGAYVTNQVGGTGGAGAPGGGGGGGGASDSGRNSGAGGNGGSSLIKVISW